MHHPVYHCNDNCQSLSSFDALAVVPVANQRWALSKGLAFIGYHNQPQ